MANAPDLAKLRIDRDGPPAAVRRAFTRSVGLAAGALVLIGGVVFYLRRGSPWAVQVVTATSSGAFAVTMGLVGGFFPAWRAARLQVVQALR